MLFTKRIQASTTSVGQALSSVRNRTLLVLAAASLITGCIEGGGSDSGGDDLSGIAQANITVADVASSTETNDQLAGDALAPVGQCSLSVLDEQILQKINEVRAIARSCGETYQEAVDPVVWHCSLENAALSHSKDMGDNNFFSHTGSDGLRVGARADIAGYDWVRVGENIAVGYSSVDAVVNAWLASPSHCTTIMDGNYEEMANALYMPAGADYDTYWTLLMGKSISQ